MDGVVIETHTFFYKIFGEVIFRRLSTEEKGRVPRKEEKKKLTVSLNVEFEKKINFSSCFDIPSVFWFGSFPPPDTQTVHFIYKLFNPPKPFTFHSVFMQEIVIILLVTTSLRFCLINKD